MQNIAAYPRKSTTVRAWDTSAPVRKWFFQSFPALSARLLTRRFLKPWRRVAALSGQGARARFDVAVGEHSVPVFIWGHGPLVVLSHGWSGGASQLTQLMDGLIAAGYSVAAFDAPAHGGSAGSSTNLGQFVAVIEGIVKEAGAPVALIGHSLGGMAAALASHRGVHAPALVLLAPMPSFNFALDEFQKVLGFGDELREQVALRVEGIAGITREEVQLDVAVAGQRTLVVHDVQDRSIDAAHSRGLAARHAGITYRETYALGHKRLLRDQSVIDEVVAFVRQSPVAQISPLERSLLAMPQFEF